MTGRYRELVGLRVRFSKVVPQYNITNYYRWSSQDILGPVLMMRGYDMERAQRIRDVLRGLLRAYAPAVQTVWKCEDEVKSATHLCFRKGGMPKELCLDGDWELWAEK